jgi:hypothetical protein
MFSRLLTLVAVCVLSAVAAAQSNYTPQFKGDPAHSSAEAAALGYIRTVTMAERLYKKKHGEYATSLAALVAHGSFTRRMVNPDRGDYTVHFTSTGRDYTLSLVPKQFDSAHRAFFTDDNGPIRVEDDKPATAASPKLKVD